MPRWPTCEKGLFVNKKAALLASCPGYLMSCLLTSTTYIITENSVIGSGPQDMLSNLHMFFVSPQGTEKLQALKEGALQPMHDVNTKRDMQNCIIEKCTSLVLVKMENLHPYLVDRQKTCNFPRAYPGNHYQVPNSQ